ncbi:MAG: hypothetical protein PHT16_03485 [Candidatus Pacebacteria bacterium]|nr:hypothetical protein [Candidatus Paceibacterota bacterium]
MIKRTIFLIALATAIIFAVVWGSNWIATKWSKKEAKKAAEEKAKEIAKTQPPTQTASRQKVEALVLDNECLTPCSGNIPAGRFKIRTDGHPLRIKFKGVHDWVEHPAEGEAKSPSGVEPGEAQFVSSDKENPHVKVWVYKKITVPGGR